MVTSDTRMSLSSARRNVSLNDKDRPRPILKARPLSCHVNYKEDARCIGNNVSLDQERAKAESLDTLSSLDRGENACGVKRSATFSGRRRVSIDLCEFDVLYGIFET